MFYICLSLFFFFNDTATTEIYTLSLHDALPICVGRLSRPPGRAGGAPHTRAVPPVLPHGRRGVPLARPLGLRSEEHTSELQSLAYLVCRLLLEKKKNNRNDTLSIISTAVPYTHH